MATGRHRIHLTPRQRAGALAIAFLAAVVLPVLGLISTAGQSSAAPTFSNARIADNALTHVNRRGGQCWDFVANMIRSVGGRDIRTSSGNPDYFVHLQAAGGTRVSGINDLRKGDVVQEGQGVHTFIIVGRVRGNTFDVVDSNHDWRGTVMHYKRTVTLDNTHRAYRFGRLP